MKVAIVYDTNTPFTTGVYFHRAFLERGMHVTAYHHDNVKSIPDIYDLYFIVDSGPTYEIPKWTNPSVYYGIDVHLDFDNRLKMALTASIPIMAQFSCGAQRAANLGHEVLWMPLGCDPWIHQDYQVERDLDIAFVGHLYEDDPWRTTLKNRLLSWGFQEDKIFIGNATKEEMGHIYSRAKIVLNASVRNNRQDINMRVFEAMSSGAYLLTQKLDHDDMDKIIDPNLYSTFTNDDELREKIVEILENQVMYRDIAEKGKLFIRTMHTYSHHLDSFFRNVTTPKEDQYDILTGNAS